MKRHILIYGVIGGILIALLQWSEYRFVVIEHSVEIYAGLVAVTFAILGIWLGLKLTGPQRVVVRMRCGAVSVAVLVALQLDGSEQAGEFLAIHRSYGNLDDQCE